MLSESSPITSNPITFNSSYPTYDGNGNVSEYLDSTGQVIAHYEYDPFGNTVVNTDTANQFAYRFSTKPIASATGLYYYGYRYYDPLTGRWPSRDPIEERGGLNLYGFAGNDLQNWIDYLGLIEKKKDDFGRECCEDKMVTITIYTSPAGSSGSGSSSSGGKNVGHTYMHHPNVGYRGNYPSGYEDDSKHGRPKKGDKKSKELKACPESAKKIEDDMKEREKAGKNYGLGPGGKPNCTEAACDIIEDAGHDMPNDWTPSGLHDSLQK
jgi:RHS repeat-associated protein